MRIRTALIVLVALAASSSCAPPSVSPDAGSTFPPARDGGPADAGALDAGPPDAGPDDAGPLDAGLEDAGSIDAGPSAEEGEACDIVSGPPCDDSLVCLRPSALTSAGVCRVDCSLRDAQGELLGEQPLLCDEGSTCQTVRTPTLNVLGVACLPAVETRDELCAATEDDDACAGDLFCSISASEVVLGVLFVDEARCKLTCDAASPDGDEECPLSETCLGPRSPVGSGVCGRAVPLWDGDPIPDLTQQCNEATGHDYCDDRPLRGLASPAELECVTGFYLDPHVGLCMATCSQPAFDYNGDGEISDVDGELALELECAAGFVCDQQRARDFGLIEPVRPELLCDDFGCFPGEPCPACGAGAECVLDLESFTSKCAAVYGFCVPGEPPDDEDAGPLDGG